jgi:hypothetical protein
MSHQMRIIDKLNFHSILYYGSYHTFAKEGFSMHFLVTSY